MLRFTHVSIPARDPDELGRWYQALFGVEPIAAPNFGFTVRWFRVGDLQLHLYKSQEERAPMQHFGLGVDDFEATYRRAEEMAAFDKARAHHLYITPAGEVQLYLRDPDGNALEVNWPDASTLPDRIRESAIRREDQFAQSRRNREATLYAGPAH
jgi:lactoylglutathione lyase